MLDCAYVYQNEHEIGDALEHIIKSGKLKREDLFVVSKLWLTFYSKERAEICCRRSLSKLKLDYIDLYLIHWPVGFKDEDTDLYPEDENGIIIPTSNDFRDAWLGMEICKQKGLVKSIGISNFNCDQISRLLEIATVLPVINQVMINFAYLISITIIFFLQIECHPYLNQQKLIDFCRDQKIEVTAYSPLGSAPPRIGGHSGVIENRKKIMEDPLVKNLAFKYGKSVAQILIRYQIQRNLIVIPKSASKERINENFDVFNFELSTEDMKSLNELDCGCRYIRFNVNGIGDLIDYPFKEN